METIFCLRQNILITCTAVVNFYSNDGDPQRGLNAVTILCVFVSGITKEVQYIDHPNRA